MRLCATCGRASDRGCIQKCRECSGIPIPERGFFEDYSCGCVSATVKRKRELLGYCRTHGNTRRHVWPLHPAME